MGADRHLALALLPGGAQLPAQALPWGAAVSSSTVGPVVLAHVRAPAGDPDHAVVKAMHDAVVTLARHTDLIPLRLGPPAPLGVLRDALAPRAELALQALRELAGCVELDTRWPVSLPSPAAVCADAPNRPGAAFLASRRPAHAGALEAERLAEQIDALLEALPHVIAIDAPPSTALDATRAVVQRALLVPAERSDAVARALDAHAASLGRAVRITGPWPAWSFAAWAFGQAHVDSRQAAVNAVQGTHS